MEVALLEVTDSSCRWALTAVVAINVNPIPKGRQHVKRRGREKKKKMIMMKTTTTQMIIKASPSPCLQTSTWW